MRLHLSLVSVGLLFLEGNVLSKVEGIRASAREGDVAAHRALQGGANETQGHDSSGWSGESEGGTPPSENETLPVNSAPTAPVTVASSKATRSPANVDSNSTNGENENEVPAYTQDESPASTKTKPPVVASTTTPSVTEPTKPAGTEMPAVDDVVGDDRYEGIGGEEGGEKWGFEPEDQGTKAPYVPPTGDDPFAKEPDESAWTGEDWKQETPEEMMHDKNVIIAIASAVILGFILALLSAQQVIENPDGFCASICRCCVKCFCFVFKILCLPCRLCCGSKDRRSHDLMISGSDSYTHDLELT